MKNSVSLLLSEARKKLSGYTVLMNYRLMVIPVKAEGAALLSISVSVSGQQLNLEDVADAAIPNEYQFAVIPKDTSLLYPIAKAIKESYPDYKIEEKWERDGTEEGVVIYCDMPEVDENRYDTYKDMINTIDNETKAKLELTYTSYTLKIAQKLVGDPKEEVDEAKEELKNLYDQIVEQCGKYKEQKEKQIEEAYQRYLTKEQERASAQEGMEKEASAGTQMRMDEPEGN